MKNFPLFVSLFCIVGVLMGIYADRELSWRMWFLLAQLWLAVWWLERDKQ